VSAATLAQALATARAEARVLEPAPWIEAVRDVADGYAVQTQLAKLAGNAVRGWKVSALTPEQQRNYGADKPVAGAMLAPFVHADATTLRIAQFVTPLLECEVAFLLGRDLPARPAPYTCEEIETAIEAVVPAIEIADCRWPASAPDLLKLADSMGNGAFIAGEPLRDWRAIDLGAIDIVLNLEENEAARGASARILGNPLLAVVALANAQPLPAGGLTRGQIVTTGTCTTPIPPRAGAYVADFGKLGTVGFRVN
jgi:2-keto-4-pentenoate hydratase